MLERLTKAYKGRLRRATITFSLAEIKAAGAVKTLSKTFGVIPPNAIIAYTRLDRGVAVTDGSAGTFTLAIGDGTTANNVMTTSEGDVDGGATQLLVAKNALVDGGTFTALLTGSVNLSTVTAGTFEATVYFFA